MSPEQLRGEELDARTDIFSFGLVLYELITGRFAFTGGTPFEVAASILKEEARGIEDFPPGLSPGFDKIVSRLLAKSKDSRFRSFREVRESISALIQEQSADTVELTAGYVSKVPEARLPSGIPTILVMPLETVGGEAGSYIGVGLAHAITTDLAKINGLSVLSKFAGAGRPGEGNRTDRELARDLGATILLEGEIVRSGPTIGVMARLIDVESGRVIWGSQYRGDASDLFSIQDAVCENVAGALKISVSNDLRSGIGRPATRSIEAFELYSKGRAFLERRDVAQNVDYAVQVFQEALNLDSEYAPAHAGLGEAYWLKYEISRDNAWVDRAIAATDHALTLDPGEPRVYLSLGIIYHGTGKLDRAREQFERVILLQPTGDEAYQWLGRCCLRQGEVEPAITYFKKAIEIRPGYWGNYNALGACYSTFGRYREAAEQFRKVITFQPDNFLGYDDLGGIYYLLGQYEDAARMYRRAIEIYPNHRSYSNLGTACFYLGRYDDSISAYRSAIELNSRDDSHHYNLGDAYLRLGRVEEGQAELQTACELLRENLTVNPDDALSLGRLGLALAKLGRKEEAIASISRAAQLEQKNATLLYLNAVVHTLCGNESGALEWLGRALDSGYSRSEVHRDPDLEGLRHLPEYRALIEAADSFKTN
jgi:tetratricopeptide (TPR) repeat protein/TolB-like protein